MRTTTRFTALLAVAALALTACGNGDDTAANGDDTATNGGDGITITATEFEFDPASLTVPAGEADVTIQNIGVVEHDWTVDELGIEIYADGGQTTTETVTFEAGTYDVYCSIPGHREAGMEGTLTVE